MSDTEDDPVWKSTARRVGRLAEGALDGVRERLRPDGPLRVVAFRGYADDATATLGARVLVRRPEQEGDPDPKPGSASSATSTTP